MYKSEKLFPDTWRIIDEFDEALYLINKNDHACLIDTGMDHDSLSDYVKSLTDKPIIVLLTHGHIDHIGRCGEFETVCMDPKDSAIYQKHQVMAEGPQFIISSTLPAPFPMDMEGIIPIDLQGHTPGSTIFVDKDNHAVYTGDALGSGCGVWMQIEGALTIEEYRNGIHHALEKLKALGCDDTWKFFGGHANQEYQSKVSAYNPLCLALVKDMETLCTNLLNDEVQLTQVEVKSDSVPYYASYGKAEILTTKERIHPLQHH